MGFRLGLHGVKPRPPILGTVDLGVLVAALEVHARNERV